MKASIQMLSVEGNEIYFLFNQVQQPAIEIKGIQYTTLYHILQVLPQLLSSENIEQLSKIVNFLAKGLEFQFIEDIEDYKTHYYDQLEAEHFDISQSIPQLKDYGVFDLSVMHPPHMVDHQLVFYVRHDYLTIPYRATFLFHKQLDNLQLKYELLPLK